MDSNQKSALLLEMNLRFLSANLQLNSLLINSGQNSKVIEESQSIMKNLLNWLRTLNQYAQLPESTTVLVEALMDSVKKSNNYNLLFELQSTSDNHPLSSAPQNNSMSEPFKEENLSKNDESGQTNSDLLTPANLTSDTSTEETPIINEIKEIEEVADNFFNRSKDSVDSWDYISSIKSFMSSYTNLMHVLIPNLALGVAIELNKYNCQNKLLLHDSITHPTLAFQNLITKLLREAPGSNLFRRIRRNKLDKGIDLDHDQMVNASESQKIREMVSNYFDTLTKYLDPSNPTPAIVDTLYEKTKGNYKQFSLGPINIETRLTAVVKNVAETSFKEADDAYSNDAASTNTKVVYLATTQLFCDFQTFLLKEFRILTFLADLKG